MINDGGTGGDIGFLIFSLIVGAAVILLMSRRRTMMPCGSAVGR